MIRRRALLAGAAAVAAAASSFPKPALSQGRIEWRMVTSWPKGLPGLQTGADRLAKRITDLSGGRLTVRVFAAGELVPALQCFDAVASGTAEMAHDAAYYHIGKSQSMPFFAAVPFGMLPSEINAWMNWGGGQQLFDELLAPFGIKGFSAGNSGTQMGGWFRKELTSVDDFKGLKFRMPGQGGQVLQKLGATVVLLPGGEIFAALQSGAIDGTEWVGPYNDLALGFYQVAKYYYYPGFHEPGTAIECLVSKSKFDALPTDLKQIIETCTNAENDAMLSEFNYRSGPALQTLVRQHGVQLKQMPRDAMIAIGNASGELMQSILDGGDAITKKIAISFLKARAEQISWTRIADQAFANARLLPFTYPRA
jgi:TRAP-type mannitol/chloroaromatic compound transport system substrate-binding protein